MSPDAIALAAAERLAPRLGRHLPAAVARALTAAPRVAEPGAAPEAALDAIAAWMIRAARQVDDADRAEPAAGIERLFEHLGRPSGASPAIARVVLGEVIAAASHEVRAA